MDKLKPCPFCGRTFDLYTGVHSEPTAFWDSRMRGQEYGYVLCGHCDIILKADSEDEAIRAWNKRAEVNG